MRVGWKNPSLGITVCHHSASLVMPIRDPRDRFFYPTLTLMIDSYILAHRIRILEILPWDRKSHLTYAIPGRIAQSVTCLATDAKLTANPGVASSIPSGSHTFLEIDHEIISTVIFLPSAESYMKCCCQLQVKVCARIIGYPLVQACPGKKCG